MWVEVIKDLRIISQEEKTKRNPEMKLNYHNFVAHICFTFPLFNRLSTSQICQNLSGNIQAFYQSLKTAGNRINYYTFPYNGC